MTVLKFNVAQLLRQAVGAQREYLFTEQLLPLDDELVMRNIEGEVRFTRSASGVVARVHASGVVCLVCVRSLEEFDFPLTLRMEDEFHATIDVEEGVSLAKPTEEDPFLLDELHMADIGEAIREYALIALPINPVCQACQDQPVTYSVESEGYYDDEDAEAGLVDKRLEALKAWKSN
jgi:uncharacterized protein